MYTKYLKNSLNKALIFKIYFRFMKYETKLNSYII